MTSLYGRKSNEAFRYALNKSWEDEHRLTFPLTRMGYRVLCPDRIIRTDKQADENRIKTSQSDYGDLLVYHHDTGTHVWDVKELGGPATWFNNPQHKEDMWEKGTLLKKLSKEMEMLPVTKAYTVKDLWKKEQRIYCLVPWLRTRTEQYDYCILVPESTKKHWVKGRYEDAMGRGDTFWMVSTTHPDLKVLDFRFDIVDSDTPVPNRDWKDLLKTMLDDLTPDKELVYPDY